MTRPGAPARVAVVADGAGFGGAQVYARSLIRWAPADLEIHLVTTKEHAPHLTPTLTARGATEHGPDAELVRSAQRGGVHIVASSIRAAAAPELAAALRRIEPDLIQVNLTDPTSMTAALEAATELAPTVSTLHMSGEVDDRARAICQRLRHLVAVSQPFAELAVHQLRLPPERVTHILNGVDPVPVQPPRAGAVIGSLGRLTRQKGFDVLIEAVRLLVARDVGVDAVIAGDGRERAALERQAVGLPVRFAGFQAGPLPFLSELDVFCLPSRVEALPLSLLEAVSAGLPAVATDVGDVRLALGEVVAVVPPEDPGALADAVEALLRDGDAARARGTAGAALQRRTLTAQRMAESAWAACTR